MEVTNMTEQHKTIIVGTETLVLCAENLHKQGIINDEQIAEIRERRKTIPDVRKRDVMIITEDLR